MKDHGFEVEFPLGGFLPQGDAAGIVSEPARDLPVLADCDVAVLGGGPAGVCAAAAAARAGRQVVLVERYGFLGGMATAASSRQTSLEYAFAINQPFALVRSEKDAPGERGG